MPCQDHTPRSLLKKRQPKRKNLSVCGPLLVAWSLAMGAKVVKLILPVGEITVQGAGIVTGVLMVVILFSGAWIVVIAVRGVAEVVMSVLVVALPMIVISMPTGVETMVMLAILAMLIMALDNPPFRPSKAGLLLHYLRCTQHDVVDHTRLSLAGLGVLSRYN